MLDIPINGDSIKLGQFIKLASLVATGGEAKELIAEGVVTVNGEPETRRGATLHPGDEVLSLIHISEPTRHFKRSRMPSSA